MHHRGYTIIALLVTMACIVVLASFLLGGLNTAVTGAGNTLPGSVASVKDQLNLQEIFKAMLVSSDLTGSSRGSASGLPLPSAVEGKARRAADTSASMWSLAVMRNGIAPSMLISSNERNPNVEVDDDYDFEVYDPSGGVFWDPEFTANLQSGSNASFAHMPLWGDRLERHWSKVSLDGDFPLLGTRGPINGDPNAASYTMGRQGKWAGHVCFGDGHVVWTEQMTIAGGPGKPPDNLFKWEEGAAGGDAVLAFTRVVGERGPTLEYD